MTRRNERVLGLHFEYALGVLHAQLDIFGRRRSTDTVQTADLMQEVKKHLSQTI